MKSIKATGTSIPRLPQLTDSAKNQSPNKLPTTAPIHQPPSQHSNPRTYAYYKITFKLTQEAKAGNATSLSAKNPHKLGTIITPRSTHKQHAKLTKILQSTIRLYNNPQVLRIDTTPLASKPTLNMAPKRILKDKLHNKANSINNYISHSSSKPHTLKPTQMAHRVHTANLSVNTISVTTLTQTNHMVNQHTNTNNQQILQQSHITKQHTYGTYIMYIIKSNQNSMP
eukprot:gene13155-9001_t